MIRAMAWVFGSAAEVAQKGGWTKDDFAGVAGYVYDLERQRRLRRSAAYHFQRVRVEATRVASVDRKRRRK